MKKTDELEQIAEMYYQKFGESQTIWVLKDKEIGSELRKLREESGADQNTIAKLMGISLHHLPNYENGFSNFNKDVIYAYLKALQTWKDARESFSAK